MAPVWTRVCPDTFTLMLKGYYSYYLTYYIIYIKDYYRIDIERWRDRWWDNTPEESLGK